MADILINDIDIKHEYGVWMGEGFLNALLQPPDFKKFISNKSRLEHGARYVVTDPYADERDFTLPFVLVARDNIQAIAQKKRFLDMMQGFINLYVPQAGDERYRLIVESFSSFSRNYKGNVLSIKVKVREPNPNDR